MSIGDVSFRNQVQLGVLGKFFSLIVSFLGSVLLARLLGPSNYGIFYFWVAIATILDNPITGWATACRKRLTEDNFPSDEALGSAIIALFVSILPVTLFILFAELLLNNKMSINWSPLYISLLFVGSSIFTINLEILKSTRRFGSSSWVSASRDLIRVLAQGVLVIVGFGVSGMVGGMVMANILITPIVVSFIDVRPAVPSLSSVKSIWKFARSSIPTGLLGTALGRVDVLLLGIFATEVYVGNYQVAYNITLPAMFVSGVAASGLMGRVSNLRSRGDEFIHDINDSLSYVSILSIPLLFGAISLGREVLLIIYGHEYTIATPFLIGLSIHRVIVTQDAILRASIDGLNNPSLNLKITSVTFFLNLTFGFLLLKYVGPIGIVIATVGASVTGYLFRLQVLQRTLSGFYLIPRQVVEQIGAALIMFFMVELIKQHIHVRGLQTLASIVLFGGGVYFLVLMLTSELHKDLLVRSLEEFIR